MRSICLVKVADLVRSLRVHNPQKKAVADKKRQQACCRPPPVCDSRQLNSRLKNFYPIRLNISVELMMYRFNHQYTQLGFFRIFRYALNDEFGITLPPSQNQVDVMQRSESDQASSLRAVRLECSRSERATPTIIYNSPVLHSLWRRRIIHNS